MPASPKIPMCMSVLVVDDHPVVHHGLRLLLKKENTLDLCGEATSVGQAKDLAVTLRPDLIVLDLLLDARDGLDLIKDIKALSPKSRIVVFSSLDEMRYAQRALRAGARGYVMKSSGLDTLLQALLAVTRGEIYASDSIMHAVLRERFSGEKSSSSESLDALSDREMDVFRMVGAGLKSCQIARKMHLSPKTVSTYRERLKGKLDLPSSSALTRLAEDYFLGGHFSPKNL